MINRLLQKFHLLHEKEAPAVIIDNIVKGVEFRGTNLWILILAIFIASLGLNVNSPAVIIGAMLISPLMGPIMGIGLSAGINDLSLLKKSLYNFLIAATAALITSTIFFIVSPLNDAHSEILARTSPNIYDVLIAFFGGLAGIVATSSRQKGNVIPGVAIATALMPPLCTAGYGIATLQLSFFLGAFYLFIINTVFIALATFITVRVLKLPYKHLPDPKADRRAYRITWFIVTITLLPSIYFGYDIVQRSRFVKSANLFIETEATFPNDYLLSKKIDASKKHIELTFGGDEISEQQIALLKNKLPAFNLTGASLEIHQGFAYLAAQNNKIDEQSNQLNLLLQSKEAELKSLHQKMDSISHVASQSLQLYNELIIQYPDLLSLIVSKADKISSASNRAPELLVVIAFKSKKNNTEIQKLEAWLKVRLQKDKVDLIIR